MEQITLVKQILSKLKLDPSTLNFLAQGSTSAVWYAETSNVPVVVRLAVPHPGKTVHFEGEAGLRAQLYALDSRVARPIASSTTHPDILSTGPTWCVDHFMRGETPQRGALPQAICWDVGEFLANLHSIQAEGYGLLVDRRDRVIGQANTPAAGICTRLQDPWPFCEKSLDEHPIAQAAPDLVPRLRPLREGLLSLMENDVQVPLHTDLHERQMLVVNGRLNGLIDFGDAMIGHPVCDIGSFTGFHGKEQAEVMLEAYTSVKAERDKLLSQAHDWSIVTSLHHASRAVTLNLSDRMRRVISYLDENLPKSI